MAEITIQIANSGTLNLHESIVLGVSGGPDSLCLLHNLVFYQTHLGLCLSVAHLNHGLRGEEGAKDADYLHTVAENWGVPFFAQRVDIPALAAERNTGIEEVAREERYAFLARIAERVGASKVAVGHNADDQAETVLMHFLRGAGLAGLRGMLPVAPYPIPKSNLTLIRPLLQTPRASIETYCQEHALHPRLDRSNEDILYFRNRLRHRVIPALEEVSPGLRGRLCDLSQVAAADYALLEGLLDEGWGDLQVEQTNSTIGLDLALWKALPLSLRRMALRRAIQPLRPFLLDLRFDHIENARKLAEGRGTGKSLSLPGRLTLTIDYEHLRISAGEPGVLSGTEWPLLAAESAIHPSVPGRTALPNTGWQMVVELLPADEATKSAAGANCDRWSAFLDAAVLGPVPILRTRHSGEYFQPLGMEGKKSSVSDYMINSRIPASLRNQIPILACAEHIVWIAGWRVDERAKVTSRTDEIARVSFVQPAIADLNRKKEVNEK